MPKVSILVPVYKAEKTLDACVESILAQTFPDFELLLIDDLGTEPLMNNVTVTQLFNLLNERQMSGRHTVLSTNLSMNELLERYTERVTSRLLDKGACLRVGFVGGDVRRERRRKGKEA